MRPTSLRAAALAGAALALVLAACSAAPTGSPAPSASPAGSPLPSAAPTLDPAAATTLVLREDAVGGFVGPTAELTSLPIVSVYADGTVIVADLDHTTGLLPALRAARLTPAGLAAVIAAAKTAGLDGADRQLDGGPAADTGATRFTLVLDGHPHVTTATRIGAPVGADAAAIAKLAAFAASITPDGLGTDAGTIGAWAAWAAPALRLLVTPHEAAEGDPVATAWPLAGSLAELGDALPANGAGINPGGAGGGAGARCGIVGGADAATLETALAAAQPGAIWTSGGGEWTVVVRPLLPDEAGATSCL